MKKRTKIIGGVIGGIFALGIIANLGGETEPEKEVAKVEEKAPEKAEKEVAPKVEPEKEVAPEPAPQPEPEEDIAAKEQMMLDLFVQQFGEGAVEFDKENKMYKITPSEAVALEVAQMYVGDRPKDTWYELVESTKTVSRNMVDKVESGYSVVLVNPSNTNNFLLLVMDGIVLYDVMSESPKL